MPSMFVSYSRQDKNFADWLVSRLQKKFGEGNVWYDKKIAGGDDWWQEILSQIDARDVFIFVMTQQSIDSPYCKAEIIEARRFQRPVIPLMLGRVVQYPDELSWLQQIQYVDFRQRKLSNDDDTFIALLNSIEEQAQKPRSSVPIPPEPTPCPQIPKRPERFFQLPIPIPLWFALLVVFFAALTVFTIQSLNSRFPSSVQNVTISGVPTLSPVHGQSSQSSIPTLPLPTTPGLQIQGEQTPVASETLVPELIEAYDRANAFNGSTVNSGWSRRRYVFEDGVAMVLVPPGCFLMGGEARGEFNNLPRSYLCITLPFWIDETEVTQDDFVQLGGRKQEANAFEGAERPVETISWTEARDFCRLRSALTGDQVRLPTELEWEYAARGPSSYMYPWGNDWFSERTVFFDNSALQTANVGSLLGGESWVGAHDMVGNVSEWTSTVYFVDANQNGSVDGNEQVFQYPYTPTDGREETRDLVSLMRVIRGGSFFNIDYRPGLSTFHRNFLNPSRAESSVGFRCVRSA